MKFDEKIKGMLSEASFSNANRIMELGGYDVYDTQKYKGTVLMLGATEDVDMLVVDVGILEKGAKLLMKADSVSSLDELIENNEDEAYTKLQELLNEATVLGG